MTRDGLLLAINIIRDLVQAHLRRLKELEDAHEMRNVSRTVATRMKKRASQESIRDGQGDGAKTTR